MKIFIHTNNKQLLGAQVSSYMYKYLHDLDVDILNSDDLELFKNLHNKHYLRNNKKEKFNINDLQSFTLARFLPESLTSQDYLVHDPDVFPIKNPIKKIKFKEKESFIAAVKNTNNNLFYSSVFFSLNRSKKLWDGEKLIKDIFNFKLDYHNIIQLNFGKSSNKIKISELPSIFNSFDYLDDKTILLHNTARLTQPWKSGLKVDFVNHKLDLRGRIKWFFKRPRYINHPDPNQEKLFYKYLKLALSDNYIQQKDVYSAISKKYIRPDSIKLIENT